MWKSRDFSWLQSLARLKPGVTAAQAQAMINPLAVNMWINVGLTEPRSPPRTWNSALKTAAKERITVPSIQNR